MKKNYQTSSAFCILHSAFCLSFETMPTPLSISYVPGYIWTVGETITEAKLNLAANPTISLLGTITTSTIGDGAITTAKLADGAVTTPKIADGAVTPVKFTEASRYDTSQYAAGIYAAGVYAITLSPAATAYAAGMVVRFKADTANTATGAVDINVNGLGVKNLFKNVTEELVAGDIPINGIVTCIYDGTNFQLSNLLPEAVFTVSGIAISALPYSTAHSLGSTPRIVRWMLVMGPSTQLGFAEGDEVDIGHFFTSSFEPNFVYGANETDVWIGAASEVSIVTVPKAGGAYAGITVANWTMKCYAFR
jgi:hypothetical protein